MIKTFVQHVFSFFFQVEPGILNLGIVNRRNHVLTVVELGLRLFKDLKFKMVPKDWFLPGLYKLWCWLVPTLRAWQLFMDVIVVVTTPRRVSTRKWCESPFKGSWTEGVVWVKPQGQEPLPSLKLLLFLYSVSKFQDMNGKRQSSVFFFFFSIGF